MSGHWLRITSAALMPSSVWVGGIRTSAITTSGCSRSTAASSAAASAGGGRDLEPGALQQLGQASQQQHRVLGDHHAPPRRHGFHLR